MTMTTGTTRELANFLIPAVLVGVGIAMAYHGIEVHGAGNVPLGRTWVFVALYPASIGVWFLVFMVIRPDRHGIL